MENHLKLSQTMEPGRPHELFRSADFQIGAFGIWPAARKADQEIGAPVQGEV